MSKTIISILNELIIKMLMNKLSEIFVLISILTDPPFLRDYNGLGVRMRYCL